MWVGRPRARRRRTGGPVSTVPSHLPLSCTRPERDKRAWLRSDNHRGSFVHCQWGGMPGIRGAPGAPAGAPCWRLAAYLSGAGLVLRRFACCSPAAHPQARPHIITHRHHHHPHNNTWRRLPTAICTCGLPICLRPAAAAAAATAAAAAASCVCRHCPSWWCRRVVTQ